MDDFNKNIVKWVTYDNEIKKYSDKLKKLRSEKNTFESEIITFIENNDLKDNIFNLPSYSSKVQYNTNKSYETRVPQPTSRSACPIQTVEYPFSAPSSNTRFGFLLYT